MDFPFYHVDAFASGVFSGNPAGVCLLQEWISDGALQAVAAENNQPVTAFLVPCGNDFELRWFTPLMELALCGHGTLAGAHVLFKYRDWPGESVCFQTRKSGRLIVEKADELLRMNFPSRPPLRPIPTDDLGAILGVEPVATLGSQEDWLVVLDSEANVRGLKPDMAALSRLDCRGVIVTARGETSDFVSRFFAPSLGIPEDPVTGSAHCVLTPYWSNILNKKDLHALQVSPRGGELFCRDLGERVDIAGRAVLYLEGTISI